ncbi:MAG: trigger factor [Erysipelotrichaceae bacterium]|nr:trigger factor [Erysipelotrichaceae bacterium]
MRTYVKSLENNQISITVYFEGDQWRDACTDALKALAATSLDTVRDQLGPNLYYQAANNLLNQHMDEIIAKAQAPVAGISADITKVTEDYIEIILTCDKEPEITLKQYLDLPVAPVAITEVTEAEINQRLAEIQEDNAYYDIKDEGKVEVGDTTIIDFEGFKDGVAFSGGKGTNYELIIGSHSFIPGFEEAMVGMENGETKDIPLTFPENYQSADLAGANVVFTVTVNQIKVKVLPEIDDDLALDTDISGVETLDDLVDYITKELKQQHADQADQAFTDKILEVLIELNPFDVPEGIIESQTEQMVNQFQSQLYQQGMSISQYLKYMNITPEQFKNQFRDQATTNAKIQSILQAVIKAENLIVTDDDVEDQLAIMANQNGMTLETLSELLGEGIEGYKSSIRQNLIFDKALAFIKSHVAQSN